MNKVLVSYVDPLDATAQVAMTIAEQLCRRGLWVELRPVHRARASSNYRAVVMGGAVADGGWDLRAVSYLRRCAAETERRPVWAHHTRFPVGPQQVGVGPPAEVVRIAAGLGTVKVPTFDGSLWEPVPPGVIDAGGPDRTRTADDAVRHWADEIAWELAADDIAAADRSRIDAEPSREALAVL